ncbi:transglycosylase SLT domain-containing protein, partial [Candidatus Methylomirabilis sp.]|uniref:lytic transglycosylase domain-containing protein n=1 Tax=Candidatus Methylomirabilis sp. TaxID=2032687 RepID=UPI003C787655
APLPATASPEVSATLQWREALTRIGTHDYQGAAPLLDEMRHRDGFSKAHEANFLLGVVLYRQKQWREAADALEVAATQVPVLGDYALYYAASAYQALGLNSQALATLSRLLHEYPESLLTERTRQERARLYFDANQLAQAEEAYRDYLSRASGEARRREAQLALAEIAVKEDKRREAETLLRELWLKWPASREAARAGELLASMAEVPPFTLDEQFERALSLYRSSQYAQAIIAFTPFLPVPDSARGSDGSPPFDGARDRFASRARLWSGVSYFHRRDYSRAISLLSPLGQDHSLHSAEALYWTGRSHARVNDSEKAITTWTRLVDAYPNSPFSAESLYLMALQYSDDGKPKQAARALTRLLKDHSSSRFADAALWTRAWIHYRQSALTQALADLRRLHARGASGSQFQVQALYWQGRVLEGLKKRGKAVAAYRGLLSTHKNEDYYVEQTRLRLKTLEPRATRSSPAKPVSSFESRVPSSQPETRDPRPETSRVPDSPRAPEAVKARLLKELNLREEAAEEFWALAGRSAEDRGLLYEACSALLDLGYLEKSVWIAKRLLRPLYARSQPAEPVPRYWEFLYPLGYWGLVQEQSTQYALDPYLVVALIREESAFGERVVSSSGAIGLMQLLPTTANHLVNAKGSSGDPTKLDAPADNIALGTRYLAMMIEEFKGNWARALAAYNAGPNQVRRWLGRLGDRTDDEFIEEIPFSETRAYVKRVLGSYYRYRAQYGKG